MFRWGGEMKEFIQLVVGLLVILLPVFLSFRTMREKESEGAEQPKAKQPEASRATQTEAQREWQTRQQQRQFQRKSLAVGVNFSTMTSAVTTNISEGGLFIATKTPPPVGSMINVQINLPNGLHVQVPCVVQWQRPHYDSSPGCGVRFDHLSTGAAAVIHRLVEKAPLTSAWG